MALFQKSVLHSIKQDESLVATRWANFQNYLSKIEFIKTVKEEKYQDGFLKDIFEACLGYTLDSSNPSDFNLEREKKNETDGKKADGVLYVNGEIIGIVELKDQKTKNLDAVEGQAFNYHNSHSNSKYIIISNFDELRFYIDKKIAYEKFNLFTLTYDEFKTLHLLISYESIKENIPLKLKEKSANFEATISKKLYSDFSTFRTHLFENIVKNNDIDKQTLLRLTQKLCDRIIFILFAEDTNLLKPNTVKEIREYFKNQAFTSYSLYDIYKFYFNAINEGNSKLGIDKYNGGLFATDEMLDTLIIDDSYLDVEAQKLSDYNFGSDISVNILGHIFEQSLTDLEEINASINDTEFDKKKSKRKKDGVFYTPEYITRYIVENTLGKLCTDKKEELKIEPETVVLNPRKLSKAEQNYKETLTAYREWLTHLKILDPACGSGAFLNQALEFLIREHTLIRDLLLPYEDLMIGYEIEKSILEHNLYGVDINEDAVEIARLSLWLRTAHKGRELINLGAKIKCGNSLIADKSVAENAFVWEEEFPEVFAQGGFDVVIGNPPYIPAEAIEESIKKILTDKYISADGRINLYIIFYELGLKVLNKTGILGFITPYTILKNQYYTTLRRYILENYFINQIVDFSNIKVFEDATVDSIMLFISKSTLLKETIFINNIKNFETNDYETVGIEANEFLKNSDFAFHFSKNEFVEKIHHENIKLKEIVNFNQGIITGNNKELLHTEMKSNYVRIIKGADFNKYSMKFDNTYLDYSSTKIHRPRKKEIFEVGKLLLRQTGSFPIATIDEEHYYTIDTVHNGILVNSNYSLKYVLTLLNSSLLRFIYESSIQEEGKAFAQVKIIYINELPMKEASIEKQKLFVEKADLMIYLNKQLQTAQQNFFNELYLEKISQKLQNFEALEFDEFIKEYSKAKKLKFADKLEERNFKNDWSALFENDKKAVSGLKEQIAKTDKEIDAMVYTLYGLSEDEIGIVEGR